MADAVAVVHFGFVAFVVVGGFLTWRWPRLIWAHLPAAGWGAATIAFSLKCPLTYLENALRVRAGRPELVDGFIDTYIEGVLYPERYVAEARAVAAVVVLVSWVGFVQRRRRVAAQQPLVEHHGHG